jgi:uncharacterized membrane protein (TIGR02234 family)
VRARAEYATVLLLQVLAAAAALLVAFRTWQTVVTPRPRPFRADVLQVTGRDLDAVPVACALVALAGAVAVLATRRWARRVIGAGVALAGILLAERSIAAAPPVDAARARALVRVHHPLVSLSASVRPTVDASALWPALSAGAGVLVAVVGIVVVLRGHRWSALSARYEPPTPHGQVEDGPARARADASLWSALERGEDPTDFEG